MIFYLIYLILILQRLGEMSITSNHLKQLSPYLMSEINKKEKIQMILLHTLWFVSSLVEFFFSGHILPSPYFELILVILLIFQFFRFHIIRKLDVFWTTLPIAFSNQKIYTQSLYKYIKHPNYLIVVCEIFLYPLLGLCLKTSIVFGMTNLLFLVRRMKLEENELMKIHEYKEAFHMKRKILPFFFLLIISSKVFSRELNFSSPHYESAKNKESFFKFTGESTKLGFITTDFDGYAKVFKLQFSEGKEYLENILLTLESNQIDSDNGQRNEKMWNLCLEAKKYPTVEITAEKLDLSRENQEIDVVMKVRGENHKFKIFIKKMSPTIFQGKGSFKLSEAKIPDPSIAIAKVKDEFKIQFQINLAE
jgi:methyltransferase